MKCFTEWEMPFFLGCIANGLFFKISYKSKRNASNIFDSTPKFLRCNYLSTFECNFKTTVKINLFRVSMYFINHNWQMLKLFSHYRKSIARTAVFINSILINFLKSF